MRNLVLLGIGLGLALLAKAAGRFGATVFHIDPTGSRWTIGRHLELIAKLFGSVVVISVVVLAVFLVPAGWASWAVPVGLVVLVLGNLTLGGLSGTSESLGRFLSRWARWTEIERQLAMKRRTRDLLRRYMAPVLILVVAGLLSPGTDAAGSCAIVLDPTMSLNSESRCIAISFLESTIFEYMEAMDCSSVVIVTMSREPRFAARTTLKAVRGTADFDCAKAPPVPLSGEAALFRWSRNVSDAARQEGISLCERSRQTTARSDREARAAFVRDLESALHVEPTLDYSPIVPTVQYLAGSGVYTSIVVVTDLLDNPKAPVDSVAVPNGASVVLIAVEPNPRYGTLKDVISRAREWEEIRNVTVVTVNELQPGLWAMLRDRK